MRGLFYIFLVFTFTFTLDLPAAAQTPALKKIFAEGVEKARRGDFENASANFRRALLAAKIEKTGDAFLAKIHFNLGVCLYRLKLPEKSVAEFTEAIKLSRREYRQAFYALGMAERDLRNFVKAENAFLNALKADTSDGEAWFDLGMVYLEKTEFEKAENAFENAVKFKSVSAADALNNLGVIAALRHEFERAENYFEEALELSNNQSKTAKNNLQFCKFYRQQNQLKDLIASLKFARTEKQNGEDL